jgi:glycosyltransferase involved in cell wall biosynthesis
MGGAELSLLDILAEASRSAEGFLVTSEPGALADRARALGITVVIVPCSSSVSAIRRNGLIVSALLHWKSLLSFFRYVLRVRALALKLRPQLIHANVPKSHITLFLLARSGFKGICCFHLREIFERGSLPFRLYAVLFPKRNAFVIAISNAVLSMLPPSMQRAGSVIYNGIDIPPLSECQPAKNSAPLRFLYLGRVVPWKGCHRLIEAFSTLCRDIARTWARCTAPLLDIVGDTMYWDRAYRNDLEALIARSGCAQGSVRLLPHTASPLATLCDHDVFCIASENEPFGRVVAEAMACGLPVIGFATGGLPEVVEQGVTGMLVPQGDGTAMASAMRQFVDNKELMSIMGAAARQRAEALFNKRMQMKKIVDRLLAEARRIEDYR